MSSVFFVDPNDALAIAAQGNPQYTGLSLQTASTALPIPIVWGTRRVTPNIIWMSFLGGTAWQNSGVTATIDQNINPAGYATFNGRAFIGQIHVIHVGGGTSDYGDSDSSNSNSRWWAPAIFALCEGPINDVPRVWYGGGSAPIRWSDTSDTRLSHYQLFYQFFTGAMGQAPWSFWSDPGVIPPYTDQDLNYPGTAGVASALLECGEAP